MKYKIYKDFPYEQAVISVWKYWILRLFSIKWKVAQNMPGVLVKR